MRRSVILIVVLSILCVGTGFFVDHVQQETAREYMDEALLMRMEVLNGNLDAAYERQVLMHAYWQHDAKWLNCLISHHHTRAVGTALLELSTALEQRWNDESLRALDSLQDALGDIQSSDCWKLENML